MDIIEQDINFPIRINKLLSALGIGSRREADRLIEEDRVIINGNAARPGDKVEEGDSISIDGRTVELKRKAAPVLLAFNKPRGIVCSSSRADRAVNIIEYINYPQRIFPIGMLDKDSHGLILLTTLGELVNLIYKQRYGHEKEYLVTCKRAVPDEFLEKLSRGVRIKIPVDSGDRACGEKTFEERLTRPCKVYRTGKRSFGIIRTQGYNRQIRRMCAALGNQVDTLKRVRRMNIELLGLPEGKYREISGHELQELEELIEKENEKAGD